MDVRAGVAYETSAVPPAYLSLSSLDFTKWIASIGGSLYVGDRWRFDAVLAHVFAQSVYVDPDQAQIPRINPLPGRAPLEAVNGGQYDASADVIGVGLVYKF
jgi:long-subunit fatty acid transport protein